MSMGSAQELQQILGFDGYLKLNKLQDIAKSYFYWFAAEGSRRMYHVCSIGSSKNFYTTKLVLEKELLIPSVPWPHIIWHREWACSNVLYFIRYLEGVYTHALNIGDHGLVDILQKEFSNDIKNDLEYFTNAINMAIETRLKADIIDGEYVAWLLEFKKKHFGFDESQDLPVL